MLTPVDRCFLMCNDSDTFQQQMFVRISLRAINADETAGMNYNICPTVNVENK